MNEIQSCRGVHREAHLQEGAEGAQNYTHTLLKRIMFLYLIGCKGWLLGTARELGRDFMHHVWEAYRQEGKKTVSTGDWLPVLLMGPSTTNGTTVTNT
ncbi:MAG: hypothetical protein ACUVWA_11785 [Candidatus Oleimicrobiaceae bacterium]